MKKTFIYFVLLFSFSYSQNTSPYLQEKISILSDNEFIPITIELKEKIDIKKLKNEFEANKTPKKI